MPEISVIVPVYKVEPYLRRCVDSILAQTFTDFELILVDDGSPDNSGLICDEYAEKDSRVRVIHKQNGGVSSARNAGIDAARGNWITFVDSDDYVSETYLEDLYEPEYDLIINGFYIIEVSDNSCRSSHLAEYVCNGINRERIAELIELNGREWMDFCWAHLFSKHIIEQYHIIFDPDISMSEDSIFVLEYFLKCDSVYLKNNINYYYMHKYTNSLSATHNIQHFKSYIESEHKIKQYLDIAGEFDFPYKTEVTITKHFVGSIPEITSDLNMTLQEKYTAIRYILKSEYIKIALGSPDIFFSGTSKYYKRLIACKNPILVLVLLSLRQKM